MADPALIMLDEPSLGLAPMIVESMFGLLEEIHRRGTPPRHPGGVPVGGRVMALILSRADMMTVLYLKRMSDFARMDAAYRRFFPGPPPARTTV